MRCDQCTDPPIDRKLLSPNGRVRPIPDLRIKKKALLANNKALASDFFKVISDVFRIHTTEVFEN